MPNRDSTTDPPTEMRTKRKRPRLRRVGVVVGFLLAGAIINVLVAWSCVVLFEWNRDNLQTSGMLQWLEWERTHTSDVGLIRMPKGFLVTRLQTTGYERIDAKPTTFWTHRTHGSEDDYDHFLEPLPAWSEVSQNYDSVLWEIASGWPFRSMHCWMKRPPAGETAVSVGALTFGKDARHMLPVRPIWSGLLANTLMLVGVVGSVWCGRAATRRLRSRFRNRRHRCPDCGYDLSGADHGKCPECGEAVVSQRRQPNSRTAKQIAD